MEEPTVYGFNASAVAFGGLIKEPLTCRTKGIDGVASVALSPNGGISRACQADYNDDGISFCNAETTVEGTVEDDRFYTTTTTVQLENLNIFGRVKADFIQSIVRSRRDVLAKDACFTMHATFQGLRIVDEVVQPPLDFELFEQVPTYDEFLKYFEDEEKMSKYGPSFGWLTEAAAANRAMVLSARATMTAAARPIRCSLLTTKLATTENTPFTQAGYTLNVPGFGNIHLAEVMIKPGLRRLNMLRLEITKPLAISRPQDLLDLQGGVARPFAFVATDDETPPPPPPVYNATVCSGEGNGSSSYPP